MIGCVASQLLGSGRGGSRWVLVLPIIEDSTAAGAIFALLGILPLRLTMLIEVLAIGADAFDGSGGGSLLGHVHLMNEIDFSTFRQNRQRTSVRFIRRKAFLVL